MAAKKDLSPHPSIQLGFEYAVSCLHIHQHTLSFQSVYILYRFSLLRSGFIFINVCMDHPAFLLGFTEFQKRRAVEASETESETLKA